jgi:uncharacterized protein YndB with AHSA1/START domain
MDNEIINNPDLDAWIKKSIEINASDDKVWSTLTNKDHVKKWAYAFEAGTQVESDWQEGSIVSWKDKDGKLVMKGRVAVSYAGKMLKLGYFDDENASDETELGQYEEHYLLTEHEGKTNLTIDSGPLPENYLKKLAPQWDEALKIIKETAETQ